MGISRLPLGNYFWANSERLPTMLEYMTLNLARTSHFRSHSGSEFEEGKIPEETALLIVLDGR